jgi:hypothetical protein
MSLPKTSKITLTKTSGGQQIKKLEIKTVEQPVVNETKSEGFWGVFSKFLAVGGDFV